METAFKVSYKDKILFPVLILIMNTINILIVYPEAIFNFRFYRALLEDTFEVMICWLLMRQLIFWLDEVYPFAQNLIKRIALQLGLTLMLTCGLLLLQTEILQHFWHQSPTPSMVYTHHIWVYAIWILIHNAIYISMYMIQWSKYLESKNLATTDKNNAHPPVKETKLLIAVGKKSTFIDFSSICYCNISNDYAQVYTWDGNCFYIEKSLTQLSLLLPSADFFHANRQFIVHRNLIVAIQRIENGKLKLELKKMSKLPSTIIVGRTKAPQLKNWIKQAVA